MTSCPRLTIWEDAAERGYVARETIAGFGLARPLWLALLLLAAGLDTTANTSSPALLVLGAFNGGGAGTPQAFSACR